MEISSIANKQSQFPQIAVVCIQKEKKALVLKRGQRHCRRVAQLTVRPLDGKRSQEQDRSDVSTGAWTPLTPGGSAEMSSSV